MRPFAALSLHVHIEGSSRLDHPCQSPDSEAAMQCLTASATVASLNTPALCYQTSSHHSISLRLPRGQRDSENRAMIPRERNHWPSLCSLGNGWLRRPTITISATACSDSSTPTCSTRASHVACGSPLRGGAPHREERAVSAPCKPLAQHPMPSH